MPDEAIAAPVEADASPQDTPTTPDSAAGGTPDTETPADLNEGYLRHADYTRKTQELAQQRQEFQAQQEQFQQAQQFRELAERALLEQDEDAISEFLSEMGLETEDDGSSVDPEVAELKNKVSEFEQFMQAQQQEAEQREQATHIDRELTRLTGEGWDTENPDQQDILAQATFLSGDDGPLNVEAGFKAFEAQKQRIIENFKNGKYQTPAAPENGSPAAAATPENASLEDRIKASLEARMGSPV